MKKTILAISSLALLSFSAANADSNSAITGFVYALNGKTLACTSSAGDRVLIQAGRTGELVMNAQFATDGFDAGNDDGPPACTGKFCEEGGSTDSNSSQPINVTSGNDKVELKLLFGDDQQNSYSIQLPLSVTSSIDAGTSISAYGVYRTSEPDNLQGEVSSPRSVGSALECLLK